MGKFLKVGDQQWTLPEDTDIEALRAQLSGAVNDGLAAHVTVQTDPKQTAELIVNGRAVQAILLWQEEPQHKPSFTVID